MAYGTAILQMVKSLYLQEKSSDFDEIWYTTAHLELDDSQMTKYQHFINSRWRTPAILKIVFGHNLAADCPISVKFFMGKQFFIEKFRSAMKQIPMFHRTYFFVFLMQLGFGERRLSYRLRCTCFEQTNDDDDDDDE